MLTGAISLARQSADSDVDRLGARCSGDHFVVHLACKLLEESLPQNRIVRHGRFKPPALSIVADVGRVSDSDSDSDSDSSSWAAGYVLH
jgi:hypothetical protein